MAYNVTPVYTDLLLSGTPLYDDGWTTEAYYAKIDRILWLSIGLAILILGVLGNSLAFCALQTPYYRPHSTGFLLSALAVCDTLSLLTGLLRKWVINLNGVDMRNSSEVACRVHTFLTYTCQVVGSWTLVVFTLDRTVSVLLPLKSKTLCTYRRVALLWAVAAAVVCLFNSQIFFLFSINQYDYGNATYTYCNFKPDSDYHFVFYWLDTALFSIIPSIIIIICNALIVSNLMKMKRDRKQLHASGSEKKKLQATTALLMTVSLVFLFCTLPYVLYFALFSYIESRSNYDHAYWTLVSTCLYLLYFANNAVNFILYCVSAERFRKVLQEMLCKRNRNTKSANGNGVTWRKETACQRLSATQCTDVNRQREPSPLRSTSATFV